MQAPGCVSEQVAMLVDRFRRRVEPFGRPAALVNRRKWNEMLMNWRNSQAC